MHHHYLDITSKLGSPLWWDEEAVPRYCDFSPKESHNIYASEVILLEISCQNCGQRFKVAMSWDEHKGFYGPDGAIHWTPRLSKRIAEGEGVHYGDPPNNGCCMAGPTMNSIPLKVLEFWQRNRHEWERVPGLEVDVIPDWAKEE